MAAVGREAVTAAVTLEWSTVAFFVTPGSCRYQLAIGSGLTDRSGYCLRPEQVERCSAA
jgi:hypothetical protein